MTLENGNRLVENEAYGFVLSEDQRVLLFIWKRVEGLSIELFKRGISEFAELCRNHRPSNAVIDAGALDQESPAVAWLRSSGVESTEGYMDWWAREIVPLYNHAGIASLAVATGDPNAPGMLPNLPPEVRFKVGYFPDLETSLAWQPE